MSIKENINTNIGECVICYAENNTVTNPLCIGKDIIDASCKCKYFVHKRCINEWLNIKKNNPLCLICNSPIRLEIPEEPLNIDIVRLEVAELENSSSEESVIYVENRDSVQQENNIMRNLACCFCLILCWGLICIL
jgi:hypothetical protein